MTLVKTSSRVVKHGPTDLNKGSSRGVGGKSVPTVLPEDFPFRLVSC